MDRCIQRPGLDAHLQGIVEILRNPKSMRFGWTRTTFFEFLTDLFSKSLFWLQMLHRCPDTGDIALDKKLAEWSGAFLAEHFGDAVRGWNRFVEVDRSKTQNPKPSSHFLAKALTGVSQDEHGHVIPFSPAGPRFFRDSFDSRMKMKKWTFMRQFAEHCLSRAGYLKASESVRQHHRAREEYDARREAAKAEGLPWEPLANANAPSLFGAPPLEKLTFPQMSEAEFSEAWDRNGKPLRELANTISKHEKKCPWDSMKHYHLVSKCPLPIKAVMQRDRLLKAIYWLHQAQQAGRTPEAVLDPSLVQQPRPDMISESLLRKLLIANRLGLLTSANLDGMKRGKSPVVTFGPCAGEIAEVDHILPVAKFPQYGKEFWNLELMPQTLNRRKSDKVDQRQLDLLRKLHP